MHITSATIARGTAVHAVEYDVDHPKLGLLRGECFARTMCGQVAVGKGGYRTRVNGAADAAVTCKKCAAKLASK